MNKLLLSILTASLFFSVQAQAYIYKCKVGGKTTYSQQPCAASAEKIQIKTNNPTEDQLAASRLRQENGRAFSREQDINKLNRANSDMHHQIERYQRDMDRELAALQNKKGRAANNRAGAEWESSMSQEMQAITSKYQIKIQTAQQRISINDASINRLLN